MTKAAPHSKDLLRDPTLWVSHAAINDRLRPSIDRESFEVHNPATQEILGRFPDMTVEDAHQMIQNACQAFGIFSKSTPQCRANILQTFHELVLSNEMDLATLISLENGKSLGDALAEVRYGASYLQWNSGEALRMYGRTIPSSLPGTRNFTKLEPVGVVAALCPWNFPVGMICRKAGPALAVGCSVIIKVPAETPYSVLALLELSRRAGVPAGVLEVITTERNLIEIGKLFCTDRRIKKISFTGSTGVGKILMQQASGSLKKLSMELGGNAPFIVFEDAELDAAVSGALSSKFRSSGQTCVCANRIYVHASIHDLFAQKLAAAVDDLKVGPGLDEGVNIGPLIHSRAVAKCVSHVEDAVKRGAKIMTKERLDVQGPCYFPPVVLAGAPSDCLIADEETFGPVACLIKFTTEEEVIALANATDVGLAGYFFTQNANRIWRVSDALETGMVGVNTGVISQAVIPFGGVKESGFGKEGGSECTLDYCVVKTVIVGGADRA